MASVIRSNPKTCSAAQRLWLRHHSRSGAKEVRDHQSADKQRLVQRIDHPLRRFDEIVLRLLGLSERHRAEQIDRECQAPGGLHRA